MNFVSFHRIIFISVGAVSRCVIFSLIYFQRFFTELRKKKFHEQTFATAKIPTKTSLAPADLGQ